MSVIYHSIKAFLYPNPMKNAKGKYLARTSKNTTYNIREICESIAGKTGTVAKADALEYHAKLIFDEIVEQVMDGNKVDCGYFTAQANIKGSFSSKRDSFDTIRHSVEIVFSSTKLTRQKARNLKAEILHSEPFNYGIRKVTDGQTKLNVSSLKANRLLVISGDKIKIIGNDPSVGVYFINTENSSEIHLRSTDFYENGNATVKLFVPELAPGTYQLKIITQYSGNTIPLTQARSFFYQHLFHVD